MNQENLVILKSLPISFYNAQTKLQIDFAALCVNMSYWKEALRMKKKYSDKFEKKFLVFKNIIVSKWLFPSIGSDDPPPPPQVSKM